MRNSVLFIWVVVASLILTAGACSGRRDRVINVAEDDTEMNAAMAKARETLPRFWAVFENPKSGEKNFALKVKITDQHGTEYFWANGIERRDGNVKGTINNDPDIVRSVKLGDVVEIAEADIADWTYMRDGKMVGNRTLRVLFKQMPAKEVEALKKMMVEE